MIIREAYKGYDLIAHYQSHKDYPDCICIIYKDVKNIRYVWNVEGSSLEFVLKLAKERIDENRLKEA